MSEAGRVDWVPTAPTGRYYRALLWGRRRGLASGERLPHLFCSAEGYRIDLTHLAAYREVTRSLEQHYVPLLYPYVVMGGAHLAMLGHPDFPLRTWGMLHLRQHVIRYRNFLPDEPCTLHCELTDQRRNEKGLEFDFYSEVIIQGQVVWRSTSAVFKRGRFGANDVPSRLAERFPKLQDPPEIARFDVPRDIGRRYARVTGDYNPIHLSAWAAKLFGFRRSIAHGMWTTARALRELPATVISDTPDLVRLDIAFKGPVYTGSRIRLCGDSKRFDAFCDQNPRPILHGVLSSVEPDEML